MSPRRILLALALLLAAAPAAEAAKAPKKYNGSAALCAKTFDQVVLAGAHNAMSSAQSKFNVPNQQVGIPAQLKLGIRALLIDTYEVGGKMYLCHLNCEPHMGSIPMARVLGQIAAFLKRDRGAVLLIVNDDQSPAAPFVAGVEKSPLRRYLYRGATGPWPTLKAMVRKNQRVVVLGERIAGGEAAWYHPAYAGILQETPYSWPEEAVLTDPLRQPESCSPNRGGTTGSLFLMNHWSPPFGVTEEIAARVNTKDVILSRVAECAKLRGRVPSVIAVDMVRSGDVVGAVKALNAA